MGETAAAAATAKKKNVQKATEKKSRPSLSRLTELLQRWKKWK